jgi:hypothetical protein
MDEIFLNACERGIVIRLETHVLARWFRQELSDEVRVETSPRAERERSVGRHPADRTARLENITRDRPELAEAPLSRCEIRPSYASITVEHHFNHLIRRPPDTVRMHCYRVELSVLRLAVGRGMLHPNGSDMIPGRQAPTRPAHQGQVAILPR